jgi:cytochrome c biogenesis protein ResB
MAGRSQPWPNGAGEPAGGSLWAYVPRWLYSMKFAVWIALALALVSVAGVLVQEFFPVRDAAEARSLQARLPDPVARAFFALQLQDPFRAGWFRVLLGALAASLTLCSIRRFRAALRQAFRLHPIRDPRALLLMQSSATVHRASPEVFDAAVARCRHRLFRGTVERHEDELIAALHRGGLARTGPVFLHLGILALVLAGLVSSIAGRKAFVEVHAGQTAAIDKSPFAIRVDDFAIDRAPDGAVRQYRSQLVLLRDGAEVTRREVTVNHPLRHAGYNIYQASYGVDPERARSLVFTVRRQDSTAGAGHSVSTLHGTAGPHGAVAPHGTAVATPHPGSASHPIASRAGDGQPEAGTARIEASMEGLHPVPGFPGWEFRVARFFGALVLGPNGPTNAARSFANPAAVLEILHDGEAAGTQWAFLHYPAMARADLPFALEMGDAQPAMYTGLEVNTNPGTPFVWFGLALATAGLLLSFLVQHHCVFLLARPEARGWTLWMAGRSDRDRIRFGHEFERFVNEVRASTSRRRGGHAAAPSPESAASGPGVVLTPFV